MRKHSISKMNKFLAMALVLVMMVGTLAFFSDRVTADATIETAGAGSNPAIEIDPNPTDPNDPTDPYDPSKPPYVEDTPEDKTDDLGDWWTYLNATAMANYNPGDILNLCYSLDNTGELAVDVRETFIVTSNKPLTLPEFRLFADVEKGTGAYAKAFVGVSPFTPTETVTDGGKVYQYKYVMESFSLNSDTETIDGVTKTEDARSYYVVFDAKSGNDYQGAVCKVDCVVEAKQHTSTGDADWVVAATGSLNLGTAQRPVALPVVPSKAE